MYENYPANDPKHTFRLVGNKVCVIYDCFFPLTLGGAERWYRALSDALVSEGAEVTYLTRLQWTGDRPKIPGINIVAVCGSHELYDSEGTRLIGPTLSFGAGTFWWLIRNRSEFDAIHLANFPFFSLIGARLALVGSKTPLFVDFLEVWPLSYWRSYSGFVAGSLGALIQQLCISITKNAQVFVVENIHRLRKSGFRGESVVLPGLFPDQQEDRIVSLAAPNPPMILFVGRHVKEKGIRELPQILVAARKTHPSLTMKVVGDGPERRFIESEFQQLGLSEFVHFTGRTSDAELIRIYSEASCTIIPSLREGYGIVVTESTAAGTPVIVLNNPENLAVGLIEDGTNGFVTGLKPTEVAEAIGKVLAAEDTIRRTTIEWYSASANSKNMTKSAYEMMNRYIAKRKSAGR